MKAWNVAMGVVIGLGLLVIRAMPSETVAALDDSQIGIISQTCPTIKQTLGQLQKADSRTRSYLGAAFEAVNGRFITPLNLRLTRNNYTKETSLFEIQANFMAAQADFRTAYTTYMRELEELINTDCRTQPQDFYKKLEATRQRREALRQAVQKLTKLTREQSSAVAKLRGTL